jgi:hypothetical protein
MNGVWRACRCDVGEGKRCVRVSARDDRLCMSGVQLVNALRTCCVTATISATKATMSTTTMTTTQTTATTTQGGDDGGGEDHETDGGGDVDDNRGPQANPTHQACPQ